MVDVDGQVAPGYERVREAFTANFAEHGDVGAAFALYRDGRLVVDLWGGVRNKDTGERWEQDTLQLVFSTTKGMTAVAANLLVQRGELDLDAPVAEYWPEFKAAGKDSTPVRWLLSHKAGLPVLDRKMAPSDLFAWDPVCGALAAQPPVWEPGTAHGYHAITYGFLVGE
ncbi:MAG TPA: serine hydrolase domain-containing protein, partial [Acidimicrobiales bacterium]